MNIFLNSAGSSLMSPATLDMVKKYLDMEVELGGYEVMTSHAELYETCYTELAQLLHTSPLNIALAESASAAFNNVVSAIPLYKGDVVLISKLDYIANYMFFDWLRSRLGIVIVHMAVDKYTLDMDKISDFIHKSRPKLVTMAHIPTNAGTIQDVEALGNICRQYQDVYYAVDACQSIGQIDVNVQKLNADVVTGTGRKFLRGPRGTGFAYISDRMLEVKHRPINLDGVGGLWQGELDFGMMTTSKKYETFEHSYAAYAGFGVALKEVNDYGIDKIETTNKALCQYARAQWTSISDVECYDLGKNQSAIITIWGANWEASSLATFMKDNGVKCGITTKHTAWIDMNEKGQDSLLRLSPHYFNTYDEIDQMTTLISQYHTSRN